MKKYRKYILPKLDDKMIMISIFNTCIPNSWFCKPLIFTLHVHCRLVDLGRHLTSG